MLHIKLGKFKVYRACRCAAKIGNGHHTAEEGRQLRQAADMALHSKGDVYVSVKLWELINEGYPDA